MKRFLLAAAISAVAMLAFAAPASADVITKNFSAVAVNPMSSFQANLDFSFDNSGLNGFNGYSLTGVSGEINGDSVTGLVALPAGCTTGNCTDSTGAYLYDNTVLSDGMGGAAAIPVDYNGWLLQTTAGLENIYSTFGSLPEFIFQAERDGVAGPGISVVGTVSEVPEPLTLSLFGAGLFGAAMLRRRKQTGGLAL